MIIGGGLNVVMTVIGFGVSVMFIVFVCTRLICKRIHLRRPSITSSSPLPLVNPSNQLTINRNVQVSDCCRGQGFLSVSTASTILYGRQSQVGKDVAYRYQCLECENYYAVFKVNPTVGFRLERGLYGLESVVISKFPTKKFNIALFASSEDAKCTVCLEDYLEDDKLRILPNCGHSFHAVCIDQWLQQHSTCPICRISLRQFPENRRMPPMFSAAVRSQYAIESFESRASIDRRMQPIHIGRFESDNDGVEDVENTPNSNENKE